MKPTHDPIRFFLVGELLAQVFVDARRKLSGEGTSAAQLHRIARRKRRRKPRPEPPAIPADGAASFLEGILGELERDSEREALRQRAEEERRLRDASDEKQ